MSVKTNKKTGGVSWNMMIGIAAACLVIGFVAGVFYGTKDQATGTAGKTSPEPDINPAADFILSLERKVADDPGDIETWLQLGNLYFDTGNPERAVHAYKKYLDARPDNPDVWTDLGVMYRRLGQPGEAIKAFERAMAINPDHLQSRYNKGVVLLHDLKDTEGALKEWRILAEKRPDFKTPEGRSIRELLSGL